MSFGSLADTSRGNILALAGATFAVGLVMGTAVSPALMGRGKASSQPMPTQTRNSEPLRPVMNSPRLDARHTYPADVLRVIDGDTFQARVRVWPGLDVDTKVRLRNIDAPELRARCAEEHVKAEAARAALETILAEGDVAISQVGIDKYGGRIDAVAATRSTADVSTAMLTGGWARSYDGRRRGTWC